MVGTREGGGGTNDLWGQKNLANETWREIWTEERDVKYTGPVVVKVVVVFKP